MSLPDEKIKAQERVWNMFRDGELPRSKWPRHFIPASELERIMEDAMKYRELAYACSSIEIIGLDSEEPQTYTTNVSQESIKR